jgi:hypothetical protein
MSTIKAGDQVEVRTKTYAATGVVVSVFCKAFSDEIRCVVEYVEPRGLLHIHNTEQCVVLYREGNRPDREGKS